MTSFRTEYYPRIAGTVDMIATGTDVKPLECLLFMRDVTSRNYFDQMKGRGTRTLDYDDLKKVTPSVRSAKTHFVIVDAVGVTKSLKTDCRPLERKKSVPIKNLMMGIMMGAQDEDAFVSLAGRLSRLNKQMDHQEQVRLTELTGGVELTEMSRSLLTACSADAIHEQARLENQLLEMDVPNEGQLRSAQASLMGEAAKLFTGEIVEYLENVRRLHEQVIDTVNLDRVIRAEWDGQAQEQAESLVQDFAEFIEANRDEIEALKIFYAQAFQQRTVTLSMVSQVLEVLKAQKPNLAPLHVWDAYFRVEEVQTNNPVSELTALVALIRRVTGLDQVLTPFSATVNRNFQRWVFQKQAGSLKFNEAQMEWLRMIKDHMVSSFHIESDDLDYAPFDGQGGLGRMYELFGDEMDRILEEMNQELVA